MPEKRSSRLMPERLHRDPTPGQQLLEPASVATGTENGHLAADQAQSLRAEVKRLRTQPGGERKSGGGSEPGRPMAAAEPVRSKAPTRPGRSRRSPRVSYRVLLFVTALAVPAVAWSLLPSLRWTSKTNGPLSCAVQREAFIHEITERGTVQSASNVEIRCEVKSRNYSGMQILYIVPEGTYVKPVPEWEPEDPDNPEEPPDLLVKLDSSALESELTQKQIICANSQSAVIQAQNNLDTAEIAKEEYLNGTYVQKRQEFEADIAVAEENLARAEEYFEYSKLLHAKGYIADKELKANAFDVEKRTLERDKAGTALEVLEKYTKPKMLLELEADIKSAEAKLEAAEHSYELDMEDLALVHAQIANCTIRAPESGEVIYANITDRRGGNEVIIEEGAMVRERQVMIKLPDPKRMQVEAKVNEAKVTLVKPGMAATIGLDAFPDLKLDGVVERVNKYTAPSSWFTGNVKEFDTIIRINDASETDTDSANGEETLAQLRAGMTAEVKIRVEEVPDVLQVPVQAVVEHAGRHYCVVHDGADFRAQPVRIGSTNDKVVVIREGLDEGQQVVLNASAYRRETGLASASSETATANQQADDAPAADAQDGEATQEPSGARPRRRKQGDGNRGAGEDKPARREPATGPRLSARRGKGAGKPEASL